MDRRNFLRNTLASGMAFSSSLTFATEPKDVIVIDAMGEIRDVYTDSLKAEMIESGLNAITVTLCDPKSYESQAFDMAMAGIRDYDRIIATNPDFYFKATVTSDIEKAFKSKKIAIYYLFQNSTQFGRDLSNVDKFYDLGVRSSQITYNWQNWAGAGCYEGNGSGLTRFGHELVGKMNDIGMLIDLSHANMKTMSDTIAASSDPIIVSHTCCKDLYNHKRNTTDENMRATAQKGGLIGITQMRPFMTKQIDNAVHHYYEHIEHAINICGADHVCIGSDRDHRRLIMTQEYMDELKREEGENFDPTMWPLYFEELNSPIRMQTIWDGLSGRGMKDSVLEKIMGTNLIRLYNQIYG